MLVSILYYCSCNLLPFRLCTSPREGGGGTSRHPDTHMDIATYRLNWPRCWFTENTHTNAAVVPPAPCSPISVRLWPRWPERGEGTSDKYNTHKIFFLFCFWYTPMCQMSIRPLHYSSLLARVRLISDYKLPVKWFILSSCIVSIGSLVMSSQLYDVISGAQFIAET